MTALTLLIVGADAARGWDLGKQLDADGHSVHLADDRAGAIAKLSTHAIDVMILGALNRPADAPALLRDLRAGRLHTHVRPAQPVVTIWAARVEQPAVAASPVSVGALHTGPVSRRATKA